jgi:hypothetical protein
MDMSVVLQTGTQATLADLVAGYSQAAARVFAPLQTKAPTQAVAPQLNGSDFGALRARQDDLNGLAQSIRQTGSVPESHKLFPPYPPEQEARMVYLDRIIGMRDLIALLHQPALDAVNVTASEQANQVALALSQESRRYLADSKPAQAISSNRPLLEVMAQMDSIQ